jgi:outer membrane protein OmpA-like peptidoglycan-associated protein
VLAEHYERRIELHPGRDIYPADLFFDAGEVAMTPRGEVLLNEIAALLKDRLPWSRIEIQSYVQAADLQSSYARFLSERRALEVANHLVYRGIRPERLIAKGVPVKAPILLDPKDSPHRFREAIEITPIDYHSVQQR